MEHIPVSYFYAKPNDVIKSWSMGINGVLFRRNDGSLWMHGRLGFKNNKRRDDIPKTKPIKLNWNGDIIYSCDHYVIIKSTDKSTDKYYVVGSIYWKNTYEKNPIEIPIQNITKIFPFRNCIYVCTSTECYITGYHPFNGKLQWNQNFMKFKWYPMNIDYDDDDDHPAIQMEDGGWYHLYFKEEQNDICYVPKEVPQHQLEYYQNLPDILIRNNSDLCQLCKFDVIDVNYRDALFDDIDDSCYRKYCLTCLDYKGKLFGINKRKAIWLHHHLNADNLLPIQSFLTGMFEPLQPYLEHFTEKLTYFEIDDLIKAVPFEYRLLVKRLMHDRLLEYIHPLSLSCRILKENNYATDEIPLEPNDLGVLDWRNCDVFKRIDNIIDDIKNKKFIRVLNLENNYGLEKNLDKLYEFILGLPNLEIITLSSCYSKDIYVLNIFKQIFKLKNIKMIKIEHHYWKNVFDNDIRKKLIFKYQTKKIKRFNNEMKKYTHNYFPNVETKI